jgi:DNA-binding Lrp family transcriptional regulator
MIRAYVLIEMAAGHSRDMVNLLQGKAGVRSINRVTGPYDVIAELEALDIEALSEAVSENIHAVKGVLRTITCVCIS